LMKRSDQSRTNGLKYGFLFPKPVQQSIGESCKM
jgi:hypothetical protein